MTDPTFDIRKQPVPESHESLPIPAIRPTRKCSKRFALAVELLGRAGLAARLCSVAVARGGPDDAGAKGTAGAAAAPAPESIEFFESRVRPILADKCFKCHGEKKQSNGLRLDSREAALKGGDNGPALVAGKPDESLLVQAVAQTHAEIKMPPSGKLPDAAVADAAAMGGAGAAWPAAGTGDAETPRSGRAGSRRALGVPSDQAGRRRLPSRIGPPCSRRVDAFVVARLEAAGMSPSPPASKRTLIRRATIDLWGIPPTAEEVDAFRGRPFSECIRATGRPPAGVAALWRAVGHGTGWTWLATRTPRAMSSPRIAATRLPILTAIT